MLKSKLLASTFLIFLTFVNGAVVASKLKLGGHYNTWIGFGADGTAEQVNNFDVKHDATLKFVWRQSLKNGIVVGGRKVMNAGTGNSTGSGTWGQTFFYFLGAFGKFQIGNSDPAASYVGGIKGVGPIQKNADEWVGLTNAQAIDNGNDVGMGDAQKITYFSPKMGPLFVGFSYQPDASDSNAGDNDDTEIKGNRDGVSAMGKFSGKAGRIIYSVAAGYSQINTGTIKKNGWNMNLTIERGHTVFTFFRAAEDNDSNTKDTDFGAALKVVLNKSDTMSIQYCGATRSEILLPDKNTIVTSAGYSKNLGGGIKLEGSIFNVGVDNGSGNSDNVNENGIVLGFKVKF